MMIGEAAFSSALALYFGSEDAVGRITEQLSVLSCTHLLLIHVNVPDAWFAVMQSAFTQAGAVVATVLVPPVVASPPTDVVPATGLVPPCEELSPPVDVSVEL